MTATGYAWDPGYLGYPPSTIHPECPERAAVLTPTRLLRDLPGLRLVEVESALGLPWVQRIHEPEYVEKVRTAYRQNYAALDSTRETIVRKDMFDVALLSAAGGISLLSAMSRGEIKNGFAAIRPPGHHAGPSHARGFCIFNNVAACARFAQQSLGFPRILIVDWDVHPADGTSAIFDEDPTVHVVSAHQHAIFSEQVGLADQIGRGEGEGANYNLPLPAGTGETEYLREFEPVLDRAAARCRPDLVLVSCGFDAHLADPIGSMRLREATFARLTHMVKRVANHYTAGRLI
ncbi:MAG: histone deacetylase, partial [Dehalococcoidia bacterium]